VGALFELPLEVRQFGKQNRRLQGVESPVHPEVRMVMALESAVGAYGAHRVCQRIVIGEQRAAVAVTPQRLRREEAGAPDQGHAATPTPPLGRAEALRAVLDHRQFVLCRNRIDSVVIGHLTEQTDGQDGLGPRCDGRFDEVDIDVIGLGLDVDKDRLCADQADDFGGADPGKRDRDDFVAGADPQGAKRDFEAVGSASHGDRMPDADKGRERGLELGDLGAHDEMAVFEHALDATVDLGTIARVLFLKVNEVHTS